jgi:beta-glucanase (GH16 family)
MRRKSIKFLIAVLFLAAFFAEIAAQGQVRYRKLTFKDEFNGAGNSAVDTSKWTAETGGGGWGNQELQYYTNSTQNAYLDGSGSLVIKAVKLTPPLSLSCWYGPCQYTSARLITKGKFDQKYGKFEARIKVPRGQGMWGAFWLLGNNIDTVGWPQCGEIDIMENIGREPAIVHGTIHGPGYSGANGIGAPFSLANNAAFADDFHVYSTEWSENKISFYVDGIHYKTITPADLPA